MKTQDETRDQNSEGRRKWLAGNAGPKLRPEFEKDEDGCNTTKNT